MLTTDILAVCVLLLNSVDWRLSPVSLSEVAVGIGYTRQEILRVAVSLLIRGEQSNFTGCDQELIDSRGNTSCSVNDFSQVEFIGANVISPTGKAYVQHYRGKVFLRVLESSAHFVIVFEDAALDNSDRTDDDDSKLVFVTVFIVLLPYFQFGT